MRLCLFACLLALASPAVAQKQVNVYNWSDYIAEDQLKVFTQQTGIKVNYTTYDSNEILDAKLKAGRSGYDVVVPTASPSWCASSPPSSTSLIDRSKLENYRNLDPKILESLAKYDPGNAHAIPWMWGTIGIGYNVLEIRKAHDQRAGRFAGHESSIRRWSRASSIAASWCSTARPTSSRQALKYLLASIPILRSPRTSTSPARWSRRSGRTVRKFHSSEYINALAGGDICLAFGYSGRHPAGARARRQGRPAA
jgi:putrescine transport system substrate-binding protein